MRRRRRRNPAGAFIGVGLGTLVGWFSGVLVAKGFREKDTMQNQTDPNGAEKGMAIEGAGAVGGALLGAWIGGA